MRVDKSRVSVSGLGPQVLLVVGQAIIHALVHVLKNFIFSLPLGIDAWVNLHLQRPATVSTGAKAPRLLPLQIQDLVGSSAGWRYTTTLRGTARGVTALPGIHL